jgi:S1-C subfamily serine protease
MKKTPLYSRSRRPAAPSAGPAALQAEAGAQEPPAGEASVAVAAAAQPTPSTATSAQASAQAPAPRGWRSFMRRRERWLWLLLAIGLALAAGWPAWTARVSPALTFKQIDKAMRASLVKERLPSAAAAAAAAVGPSVVRVVGHETEEKPATVARGKTKPAPSAPASSSPLPGEEDDEESRSVGTGVVIIDNGTILTNLHVVQGAKRIEVTFADGHSSEAVVTGVQPEHDLAVLRARSIPDDLQAATMRSTSDLQPGDEVVAVGFPFGIGPSVSAGVVSGLKRDFRSPEGKRVLSNLIQFDAAANPGNSGGPLITMDGHVVGIVTAIMNPTEQATFIGIGFAVPIENAAAGAGLPPF